jgi:hypothetical protein
LELLVERRLEFGSFAELRELPEEPPSLWRGFLPLGSLGMLWGDAKKGKSTLLAALLKAIEQGEPFLGQQTTAATAVWLSEEPAQALREKAAMFELFGLKSKIADSRHVFGVGWHSLIEQATEQALEEGHSLLIVDTFSGLSGLGPEQENDAGAIAERLLPLREASARGLAVLFVHHTTKHGRKTPRGSGAFRGLVDTSIGFQRQEGSNRFWLRSESRFGFDQLHLRGALTMAGGQASYQLLGAQQRQGMSPPAADVDERLWQSIPIGEEAALSYREIVDRTGLTIDRVERRLRTWYEQPERSDLGRLGSGTKTDPLRWYRS